MGISACVGMAVAGTDARAPLIEHRNRLRCIDMAGPAAAKRARARLRERCLGQQTVEPQIEIEPDPHDDVRVLQPHNVLGLGLIFLGIDVGRYEVRDFDALAADCFGKAAQVRRGGDDAQPFLGEAR